MINEEGSECGQGLSYAATPRDTLNGDRRDGATGSLSGLPAKVPPADLWQQGSCLA